MRSQFDRRIVSESTLAFVRAVQRRVRIHLGGGSALGGAWLGHRLSRDIDLICHAPEDVRNAIQALNEAASDCKGTVTLVRDAGTFVRARALLEGTPLEVDVTFEGHGDLSAPVVLEGVMLESLEDQRASKLTCLLSRTEPRDLVDLLFLDRAGHPPEGDLALAVQKDAGIDPAALAWLLSEFPTNPLPQMLEPLTEHELRQFRDDLRERFRRLAVP